MFRPVANQEANVIQNLVDATYLRKLCAPPECTGAVSPTCLSTAAVGYSSRTLEQQVYGKRIPMLCDSCHIESMDLVIEQVLGVPIYADML